MSSKRTRGRATISSLLAGALLGSLAGCGSSASGSPTAASAVVTPTPAPAGSPSSAGLPAMYGQFCGTRVSSDASVVVLRATSVPDHPSPYLGQGHAGYEPPQAGMQVNANSIVSQNMVVRVPLSPQVAASSHTPLGVMGVAVNGVALFNQYAAGRSPLSGEIQTFDRFNGHPQQQGQYHYHIEPVYLTAQGSSRLLGVLLDGFPGVQHEGRRGKRPLGPR